MSTEISTSCPDCRVVLRIPEHGLGRRVRCPKCGTKFLAEVKSGSPGSSSAIMASLASGTVAAIEPPRPAPKPPPRPGPPPPPRYAQEDYIPSAAGELREQFDLGMLVGSGPAAAPGPPRGAADAAMLFGGDEEIEPPRRKTTADLRHSARPCPECGSIVPAGMSICSMCGLDLETGNKVDLGLDDLVNLPEQEFAEPTPVGVAVIGGLCAVAGVALAVLAVAVVKQGGIFLALLALYGSFGAVQLIRGKSPHFLLSALTLGALVATVALIVVPVYKVIANPTTEEVAPSEDDPDAPRIAIRSQIDSGTEQRITGGVIALIAYGGLAGYLVMSKSVRRHCGGEG